MKLSYQIILYAKNEEIYPAYASKHNSSVENKLFFNHFKKRRMTLFCNKKLSALLRGITSKNNGYFLLELSSFIQNKNKN